MADFNKPTLTSLYADMLTELKASLQESLIWMDGTTNTNVPKGSKRWNATNNYFEKFNGTSWAPLTTKYMIDVDKVDGCTVNDSGTSTTDLWSASKITSQLATKLGTTANAVSATTLQTARTISGVAFNGSANIDIEDRLGTAKASAATVTIGTAGLGDYFHITGTTTITSFGTASTAGIRRTLIFDGALTLTHNATSLICPGAANIVTVAGTVIEVVAETTSNWRVVSITHPSLSMAELGYLDGVTSAIQTQLNAAVPRVASTDSAIARFNGTTGGIQNSAITIDDSGNIGGGTQSFNGFGGSGFKNYIINGKKVVNQRGLTSTDNSYNQDRWYKAGNNWFQGIEGDNNLVSGKTYTLSWVGAATASYYVGTATRVTINAQTFTSIANGGNFTLTISAGQNLWIKFASDATGSTFNFVQLEEGSIATPFENRPYTLELSLCQRYYQVVPQIEGITYNNTYWYGGTSYVFPIEMRIAPTVIGGAFSNNTGANGTFAASGITSKRLFFYNGAGNWVGNIGSILTGFALSAEM